MPRVVESGYHQERLFALTGLWAGENQARRLLDDIRGFRAELQARTGTRPPENIAAVRWLDQRFEPVIAAIPPSMLGKLQAAEMFHQILEHRWFASRANRGATSRWRRRSSPTSATSSRRRPTSRCASTPRRASCSSVISECGRRSACRRGKRQRRAGAER